MSATSVSLSNTVRPRRPLSAHLRRARRRWLAPYLFVLPFVLTFAIFSAYPLIFTLRLSFTNWKGAGVAEWIGWENYTYLLTNVGFWSSMANSGALWLLIVPIQVVLAVAASVLLNDAKLKLRGFYRTAFIVPFVTPLVAMAQIWIVVFDTNYGAFNSLLNVFGLPDIPWLITSEWAKPTLALLFLWKTTGFAIIIVLSGLQSISNEVYEAAQLDGASRFRQVIDITVPLISRTLAFLVVLQTLAVFQMFAEPYVMTEGGPYGSTTTAGLYLYNHIRVSDLGTGAANSLLLVVAMLLLSLVSVRLLRGRH